METSETANPPNMAPIDPADNWPYLVEHFQCHLCGNCCRGEGYVHLSSDDIERLADHLDLSVDEFLETYADFDDPTQTWRLLDQEDELLSCIFLGEDNRCRVHEAKPQQCEDFPRRWRPPNILDFCEGWRAAAGLEPAEKKTMSE